MKIERLSLSNFRNISSAEIEPSSGVNLIFGQNAQGKTSLLEALWLFTGCRSWRTNKDKELVSFGQKKAELSIDFFAQNRKQSMELSIENGRTFFQNGIKKGSGGKVIGEIQAVIFSPQHLSLVSGGPSFRRRFLDIAISQLQPRYATILLNFNRALAQRNALLKDIAHHSELLDTMEIWEERIADLSASLIFRRRKYIEKLSELSGEIYSGISSGREELEIEYKSCASSKEDIKGEILAALKQSRQGDILFGNTSVGPHRDDISIKINGITARSFGSQGQQRSASLALKLAEAAVIESHSGQTPIAMLDDVMSELDESRQSYILNHIKDWQVFITCCDPSTLSIMGEGARIEVDGGEIKRQVIK